MVILCFLYAGYLNPQNLLPAVFFLLLITTFLDWPFSIYFFQFNNDDDDDDYEDEDEDEHDKDNSNSFKNAAIIFCIALCIYKNKRKIN